jgi:GNAT superfamily N-acetyltransferase
MTLITHAEPADSEVLASLAEEMDRFYGTTGDIPREIRVKQITEALFRDPPSAYALVAWDEGTLVGFASYSFLWPAVGLTRSLYLKELYIAETARRQRAGELLMRRLYDIAVQQDCSRVEWTTDQDNLDAQRFYAVLGVPVQTSKLFYRIEGHDLRRQASV